MLKNNIPVLCYHNVSDVDGHTPDMFRQHLDAICDAGWRTLSGRELLAVARGKKRPPRKSLVLTFDDGHISNWLTVVPELEKRGMVGTFFILTDFTVPGEARTAMTAPEPLPMTPSFRAALRDGDYSQFINESEIQAMLGKGMEVYAHGCRHQGIFLDLKPLVRMGHKKAHWGNWSIYPRQDDAWPTFKVASAYVYNGFRPEFADGGEPRFVKRSTEERAAFCLDDFQKSFERIRALNGYEEQLFCWPWGQYDEKAEEALRTAGYVGAFTLERWANTSGTNPFRLHRLGVNRRNDADWLLRRLKMYRYAATANMFFKLFTKRAEVGAVLYATDSDALSVDSRRLLGDIEAMTALGVRTCALVPPASAINAELEGLGAEVIPFDGFGRPLRGGRFLKRLVREKGIDVVHAFGRAQGAGALARLMGAKCRLFMDQGTVPRSGAFFRLRALCADGVIVPSARCADALREHGAGKAALSVVRDACAGSASGAESDGNAVNRQLSPATVGHRLMRVYMGETLSEPEA